MVDKAKDKIGGALDDVKNRGRDEMEQADAGRNRDNQPSGNIRDQFSDQKDKGMDKAKDFGNR